MKNFFQGVDAVLRGTGESPSWQLSCAYCAVLGVFYGGAMGCFGGLGGDRWQQIIFSALKVPLLLLVAFALALPPFFIVNTLLGVRDDFGLALRALLETQAGVAIILAPLAPLTLTFYASTDVYESAVLFNFAMFALASVCAQIILRRRYRILVIRNTVHQKLLWAWLACYGFVGVQMGWVLRPFIGSPAAPVRFFREGVWGNVYEVLFAMIWKVLT